MPEQELLNLLLNGGANVGFALFLLWQYKEQQKRADQRELKSEEKEKDLRSRYDAVISEYRVKEQKTREEIGKELVDVDKRLALLEQKVDGIVEAVQEIKTKFLRVN